MTRPVPNIFYKRSELEDYFNNEELHEIFLTAFVFGPSFKLFEECDLKGAGNILKEFGHMEDGRLVIYVLND